MARNEPRCTTVSPYDISSYPIPVLNEIDETGEYTIVKHSLLIKTELTHTLKNWKDREKMKTTSIYIVTKAKQHPSSWKTIHEIQSIFKIVLLS